MMQQSPIHFPENNFDLIVQTSPDGILVISPTGVILFANPAARALFQRPIDALIGCEFGYPVVVGVASEIDIIHPGLDTSIVEMRVVNIHWQDDPAYLATLRDVTSRKQTENALRESEARFRSVLQWAIEGILLVNEQGRILLANQRITEIFGYPNAALLGEPVEKLVPDLQKKSHQQLRDAYMQDPTSRSMVDRADVFGQKSNGAFFPIEVSLSVIPLETDMVIMALVVDLSERLSIETQKREIAIEHEKVLLLQRFINDVSHDFKTPLTVLSTSLYMLSRIEDRAERQARLQKMQTQITRLNYMLDTMLNLSRLDMQEKPNLALVDVEVVLQEIRDYLHERVIQAKLELVMVIAPDTPPLHADGELFYRMLLNIIENAIHYTPPQGQIRIDAFREQEKLCLRVKDTGQGIAAADLPYIFDRFYRTDKARQMNKGGSGLGLAIVKKIVEMHQGYIDVQSHVGQGTQFTILLPT